MPKKIVQLTKMKFNPAQSKSRRNNPGRKDDLIASSAPMKAVWIDENNRILSFRTMEHAQVHFIKESVFWKRLLMQGEYKVQ